MQDLYAGVGEQQRCPGPESCEHYLGAAQDSPDREDNKRNREAACEALGERCSRLYALDEDEQEIVDAIEELVRSRNSSRQPVDLDSLSPLEWEMLKVWDDCVGLNERHYKRSVAEVAAAVEALLKR